MRFTSKAEILKQIKGQLIVSCQAAEGEPFFGPQYVSKFAQAALNGGASGIRANSIPDVNAIMQMTSVPVIGLIKKEYEGYPCYITPTMKEVKQLLDINADIIAVDATNRLHPEFENGAEYIASIKKQYPKIILMADIATKQEGIDAANAGADMVSTTLSGYTEQSPKQNGPDFQLLESLVNEISIPVIAEGRIWTPQEYQKALSLGAFSVVVGSAITRPHEITKRFLEIQ